MSTVFLLLLIYSVGVAWSKILPRRGLVEGTRFGKFGPVLEFINPGEFRIKEVSRHWTRTRALLTVRQHVVATLVASTASFGNTAVLNFAVQRVSIDKDGLSLISFSDRHTVVLQH